MAVVLSEDPQDTQPGWAQRTAESYSDDLRNAAAFHGAVEAQYGPVTVRLAKPPVYPTGLTLLQGRAYSPGAQWLKPS